MPPKLMSCRRSNETTFLCGVKTSAASAPIGGMLSRKCQTRPRTAVFNALSPHAAETHGMPPIQQNNFSLWREDIGGIRTDRRYAVKKMSDSTAHGSVQRSLASCRRNSWHAADPTKQLFSVA